MLRQRHWDQRPEKQVDDDDDGAAAPDDDDVDIYIMMQFCLSRKMITFLKGLSVVSVFFQGRFMVFHGFGWSP